MDYGIQGDESDTKGVQKEVTQIGLDYSMLTKFTSFIAVSEKVRNTGDAAKDVNQPLSLPHNVSNLSVGGYTKGSEPGTAAIIVLLTLMLILGLVRLFRKRTA